MLTSTDSVIATLQMINKPKTYAALIKSLEYCVTDYPHNGYDMDWDNWHLRDIVEQGCLMVLWQLVGYCGVDGLVKGKFVERWLVKEPWGKTTEERQILFMEVLEKADSYKLNLILLPLVQNPEGRKQLEDAKLIPRTNSVPRMSVFDTRMINGESTSGEDFRGMSLERRRRRHLVPTEEDRLRRRHREAMVLNDGSQPLSRGDIIEQDRPRDEI